MFVFIMTMLLFYERVIIKKTSTDFLSYDSINVVQAFNNDRTPGTLHLFYLFLTRRIGRRISGIFLLNDARFYYVPVLRMA